MVFTCLYLLILYASEQLLDGSAPSYLFPTSLRVLLSYFCYLSSTPLRSSYLSSTPPRSSLTLTLPLLFSIRPIVFLLLEPPLLRHVIVWDALDPFVCEPRGPFVLHFLPVF
ncbi:hypothetical protein TL16_g10987 [Triparma laevis f. inornata]|uniref:Uncharacterized protein n=1 Tax=Triparma laevis f. inornata TaxID=1714386 RepID=A0A9W7BCF2_9STRA|nr:hypothetical protein TL16_g10987 [Triparma laevis f. inornata]